MADVNKQKELLKSILVADPSPQEVKARAWDSFMGAQDTTAFRGSFDSLPLDDRTKRRLYFLKFPESYRVTPPERRDIGDHPQLLDYLSAGSGGRQKVGLSTDPSTAQYAKSVAGGEPPVPMDPAYAEFDKKYELELPNLATRPDLREISAEEYAGGGRPAPKTKPQVSPQATPQAQATAIPGVPAGNSGLPLPNLATVPIPRGLGGEASGVVRGGAGSSFPGEETALRWLNLHREGARRVVDAAKEIPALMMLPGGYTGFSAPAAVEGYYSDPDGAMKDRGKAAEAMSRTVLPFSHLFGEEPASTAEEYFKGIARRAEALVTPEMASVAGGIGAAQGMVALRSVGMAEKLYKGLVVAGALTSGASAAHEVYQGVEKLMNGDDHGAAQHFGQGTFDALLSALFLRATQNGYQKTAEWAKSKMGGSGAPPAPPPATGATPNQPVKPGEPLNLPKSTLDEIVAATEEALGGAKAGKSTTISGPGIKTGAGDAKMAPSPTSKPTITLEKDPPSTLLSDIAEATMAGKGTTPTAPPQATPVIDSILEASAKGIIQEVAAAVAPQSGAPAATAVINAKAIASKAKKELAKAKGRVSPETEKALEKAVAEVEQVAAAPAAQSAVAAGRLPNTPSPAQDTMMPGRPPADINQQAGRTAAGEPPRPMSDAGAPAAKGGKVPASTLPPEDQTDELDQIVDVTRGNIKAIQQDPTIFDDPENVAILKEQIEEARAKLESNRDADPAVRDALRSALDDASSMVEKKRPTVHQSATTQIDLPDGTAEVIRKGAAQIDEDDLVGKGRESEPHITVKYGLKGDALEQVKKTLADMPPITVSLGKTSLFESEEQDVVKVDVDSPELQAVHEAIKKSVPNEESFPEYKPHVTVAYVKPGRGKKYTGKDFAEGRSLTIDAITFRDENGNATAIKLGGAKQSGMGSPSVTPPKDKAPGAPTGGSAPIEIADPPSVSTGKTPQAPKAGGGEVPTVQPQTAPQGSAAGPGKSGTFSEPPAPIAPPKTAPKPEEPKVAAKPPATAPTSTPAPTPAPQPAPAPASANQPEKQPEKQATPAPKPESKPESKSEGKPPAKDSETAPKREPKKWELSPTEKKNYQDFRRILNQLESGDTIQTDDGDVEVKDVDAFIMQPVFPPGAKGSREVTSARVRLPDGTEKTLRSDGLFDVISGKNTGEGVGGASVEPPKPKSAPEQKAEQKTEPTPASPPAPAPTKTETPSKIGTNKGDGERIPLTLLKTKNTKTDAPIFSVQLTRRHPDDVFRRLKDKATEIGGYWSNFPASKGFHFKTEEAANAMLEAFGNPVSGGAPKQPEVVDATTDPPKPLVSKGNAGTRGEGYGWIVLASTEDEEWDDPEGDLGVHYFDNEADALDHEKKLKSWEGAEGVDIDIEVRPATKGERDLYTKAGRPASDAEKKEDQPDATGSTIKAGEAGDAAEKPKTQTAGERPASTEKPAQAKSGGADPSGAPNRGALEGESAQGDEGTGETGPVRVGDGGVGGDARSGDARSDGKRSGASGGSKSGGAHVPVSSRGERGGQPGSGSASPGRDVVEGEPKTAAPKPPKRPDHVIKDEDGVGAGGFSTRVQNNLAAIRLLKLLEDEGRTELTDDERKTLSLYSGWGGLNQVFRVYGPEYQELRRLLTNKEFLSATESSINANYTSPEVIKLHWELMRQLGVKEGGRWLESAGGIGLYLGLQPLDMTVGAKRSAVELDSTSGTILKLLYPNANVSVKGFENAKFPHNFFDYAVTNVPFADVKIADKEYRGEPWMTANTHNYFIGKNIDLVKPGGIVSVISTSSSLDSIEATRFREEMSKKADLVGAIRLPENTFSKNAGASVTTDILVFRKRHEGEQPAGEPWVKTVEIDLPNGQGRVRVNEYFQKHPEMVLGEFAPDTRYHRPEEGEVSIPSVKGSFSEEAFREAMARLPKNIFSADKQPEPPASVLGMSEVGRGEEVRQDGFVMRDGHIYVRKGELFQRVDAKPREKKVIERYIKVRDALKEVHRVQLDRKSTDFELKAAQRDLKEQYDAFVREFGYVNDSANEKIIESDSDSSGVLALEHYLEHKERLPLEPGQKRPRFQRHVSVRLADVFTERVIPLTSDEIKSGDPKEAILSSMNLFGRIYWSKVEEATGMKKDAILSALKGELFLDPEKNEYILANQYLAGNVKKKLKTAIEAAKADPAFKPNVEALRAVIPADRMIGGPGITITLGANWLPDDVYEAYIRHIASHGYDPASAKVKVYRSEELGFWAVDSNYYQSTVNARERWGTDRVDAVKLIEMAMNHKSPIIYDRDSNGNRFRNEDATIEAQAKQEALREEFARWIIHEYPDKERLQRLFNDAFNDWVHQNYDGSNLTLPGMSTAGLRGGWPDKHQLDAIARGIQDPSMLLAHPVGYGKTLILVAILMEWRRLGLAKKPMMMVPNSLLAKTRAEILERYPQARVLTVTSQDVQAGNREKVVARISTGNYDIILMSDETFKRIPSSEKMIRDYFDRELADIDAQLLEMAVEENIDPLVIIAAATAEAKTGKKTPKPPRSSSQSLKNLVKHRRRIQAQMQKELDRIDKDKGVQWETLGIDGIVVDEAHMLKNLAYTTKMSSVKGIQHSGNGLTADFAMKVSHIRERSGGRNVVLATGTPILNTMGELYVMQRYLMPEKLREMGIYHFDAWAATFGKVQKVRDVKPDNKGFNIVNRFSKFVNGQALIGLTRSVMDLPPPDTVKIPVPNLKNNGRTVIVCEGGPNFVAYQDTITGRMNAVKSGAVDPKDDNLLKITVDARKAAMDMRLIDPTLQAAPDGKAAKAVEKIFSIWEETAGQKGTQLVFADMSIPNRNKKGADAIEDAAEEDLDPAAAQEAWLDDEGDGDADPATEAARFSMYDEIKRGLIERGVPANEIAFIHDYKTRADKIKLTSAMNSGQIRVLIGSTGKMGVGMNVQERLKALHHLDAPWRPGDMMQREGRILRQGNTWDEVEIINYVTSGSFDSFMYDAIERKARFILDLLSGRVAMDEFEDVDDMVLSFQQIKLLASGNPAMEEWGKVDLRLMQLGAMRRGYENSRASLRMDIAQLPGVVKSLQAQISDGAAFIEKMENDHPLVDGEFRIKTLNGSTVEEEFVKTKEDELKVMEVRTKAGEAILAKIKNLWESGKKDSIPVAMYRGIVVKARYMHDKEKAHGEGEPQAANAGKFNPKLVEITYVDPETMNYIPMMEGHTLESESPVGLTQVIGNHLNSDAMNVYLQSDQKQHEAAKKRLESAKAELGRQWEYQEEYERLMKRNIELRKQLGMDADQETGEVDGDGDDDDGDEKPASEPPRPLR